MAAKSRAHALMLLFTAFAALVLTAAGIVLGVRGLLADGPLEQLEAKLPKDTHLLIAVRELHEIGGLIGAVATGDRAGELAELKQQAERIIGFDPFSRDGWKQSGLDPERPWLAAGREGSGMDGPILLFIPVRDEKVVRASASRRLEGLEERVVDGRTLHVGRLGEMPVAFVIDDEYLHVATARQVGRSEKALAELFSLDRSNSLAASETYQALKRNVGDDWHVFGYAAPELVDAQAGHDRESKRLFAGLTRGAASTLHLSDQRLRGRVATLQDEERLAGSIWRRGDDRLGERVGGTALVATRISLDPQAVYDLAKRRDPDGLRRTEERLAERDVSLKRDVVENFTGDLSIAVLEPAGEWMLPFDPVVYAKVRDEERMLALLKKLNASTRVATERPDEDGAYWFESPFGAIGVARGHLIGAAGPSRVTELKRSLDEGGGYLDAVPSRHRSALRSGPPAYTWIDVQAGAKLDGGKRLGQAAGGALLTESISEFWVSLDTTRDAIVLEAELVAAPGGFKKALSRRDEVSP